jgi:hypothetical protein
MTEFITKNIQLQKTALTKNQQDILSKFHGPIFTSINDSLFDKNIPDIYQSSMHLFIQTINSIEQSFTKMNLLPPITLYCTVYQYGQFSYEQRSTLQDKRINYDNLQYYQKGKDFTTEIYLNAYLQPIIPISSSNKIMLKINIREPIPFLCFPDSSILLPRNLTLKIISKKSTEKLTLSMGTFDETIDVFELETLKYTPQESITKYYFTEYMKPHLTSLIQNIPNLHMDPLTYIFTKMKYEHKPNTLWLEFGVFKGKSINYISSFTTDKVYGFDSFEGLPENWVSGLPQGTFNLHGELPKVNSNVVLIKGWFHETLKGFMKEHKKKKISLLHLDADLYSSTRYVLDELKFHLDTDCIVIFDELVNYKHYLNEKGELRAFDELLNENNVEYSWIGMNGRPFNMHGPEHEKVALILHSLSRK